VTNVGFIGLGAMGLPMTRHLLGAGHTVTVASRSRGPIEKAVGLGALDGGGPAGVARASEIVLLCVPDSPDVVSVLDAMLPALDGRHIVVDCSTIDPTVERDQHLRVATTGARYLEAPLSGGSAGAEKGTLTLMVGGDPATLDAARPALEPFSARIVHCGGPGTGQVVKLCNNLIFAAQMVATAEATALAERSGIDMATLYEVLVHSTGDCVAVRTRLPVEGLIADSPASNGWRPGFTTDLMAKDIGLALAHAARTGGPVPMTALVRQVLAAASAAGYGREDFSALAKILVHPHQHEEAIKRFDEASRRLLQDLEARSG
jgi:3-hydroxyisobutyrate dehydrogenase